MISDRTPIYRYMSFQRFYEMIFTSQLTLVSPSKWPDQYEQLLLKTISTSKGQQMLIEEATQYTGNTKKAAKKIRELATVITNSTYCLCFSTEKDAEVMWNAYSDNNQAIMIETSREKIDTILFELNHCIKEVKYDLKQNETAKDLLMLFHWDPFMISIVDQDELFLHKRTIFEYEHEVRLIAYKYEKTIQVYYPLTYLQYLIL